jgi:protein ImuB
MPLAEAKALGIAHCEEHDPLADRTALEQLAQWCEQFSPTVGLAGTDCLFADVTNLALLFGSEQALAEQVERAVDRRGFSVRVAIAGTFGTAWGVTHFGDNLPIVVPSGQDRTALADLPIAALRLLPETVETLAELGVMQVGQLLELPRESLAARFDAQLLERLAQALGEVPEMVTSHRPPPEIVIETSLEYPADRREIVDTLLEDLMRSVANTLQQRQQGVVQLECRFSCEQALSTCVLVSLFRPSAHVQHLLELAHMQLERTSFAGRVTAIRLSVLIAAPLVVCQQELFAEKSAHEDRRQLGLLVDRLSSRLGRESVVQPTLLAEAQPEYAYRYASLTGHKPRRTKQSPHSAKPLPRPLCLEQQPIALEVLSLMPSGPPALFRLFGQPRQIRQSWGPERIQTGWWRGRSIHRDYYRVETTDGNQFWLFRNLLNRRWFLHGVFD